jgi:hypothetical protein
MACYLQPGLDPHLILILISQLIGIIPTQGIQSQEPDSDPLTKGTMIKESYDKVSEQAKPTNIPEQQRHYCTPEHPSR